MTPESDQQKQDGRFKPGQSGNPNGRPVGSRNRATLAAEALLEGDAEALTQKAIQVALGGDVGALRFCLERILPARKDRPVSLTLPPLTGAADHPAALAAVVEAVSAGDITPAEGEAVALVLAEHRKAIETADLAERIAALEARA